MSKKQSSLPNTGNGESTPDQQQSIIVAPDFSHSFTLKGYRLIPEAVEESDAKPIRRTFKTPKEYEQLVLKNSQTLFGEKTVLIDARKKNGIKASVNILPDRFLIDLNDVTKPKLYLLKIALVSQKFLQIFVETTRHFFYIKDRHDQKILFKLLYEAIAEDKELQKELKVKFGSSNPERITELLEAAIKNKPNVLLVMDGEVENLPVIVEGYADTWGELVKFIQVRKFWISGSIVYTMQPDLATLQQPKPKEKLQKEKIIHTEDFHLAKSPNNVQAIYKKLKTEATKIDKEIVFNSKGTHYVSMKKTTGRNLAFFHFRKTCIYLVVMLEEKLVRKMVKHHEIKTLRESVQKFWNGKCTGLIISSTDYLKEISEVLKKLIKE